MVNINLEEIRTLENQIRNNQNSLLTSLLSENGFSYSNIFDNCGRKVLGQAIYDCLKDLIQISQTSWPMDKDVFKEWIDEAYNELEGTIG